MIVVTGGAGFIGSAIVAMLNKRGIRDILVVDGPGRNESDNLRQLSFTDYKNKEDFLDMVVRRQADMPVEAVFHMGACSSTTERDTDYLMRNNFEYTKQLALWAVERDLRFIYASSAATYGDGSQGFSDDEEQIEQLQPLNAYGYSKQKFDIWAKGAGLFDRFIGLKYFNVFGPNEYHKGDMRSFVLKAFEQIKGAGTVKLFKSHNPEYGDGEYVRDFIYIKDAVEMTLFFLDNPEIGGLFNIGTGCARNWNDLVNAVFAAMGKEAKIEYVPMPDSIRNQYQYFTQADISKLRNAGYDKQTTLLEDAISDYVQHYLQKDGYLTGD